MLDDFFHVLQVIGVMTLWEEVHGTAIQRERLPSGQYVLLYGLKTLFGIERRHALPALLGSDEALRQVVGCNAQQVRDGVCQRGATTRPGERKPGPLCPDTLATQIVRLTWRARAGGFKGAIRARARAGVFGKRVTGMAAGTDLETTERSAGCGHATRKRRIEDTWGRVHELEVTVYGWKVRLVSDAVPKIPLAVKVVKMQEHEALWTRALVTQAHAHLAGAARLHTGVVDKAFFGGDRSGVAGPARDPLCGPRQRHHGRDGGCPRPRGGWRGGDRRPSGPHGSPWAGPGGGARTVGNRGGGDPRADDV